MFGFLQRSSPLTSPGLARTGRHQPYQNPELSSRPAAAETSYNPLSSNQTVTNVDVLTGHTMANRRTTASSELLQEILE
jgi:hypothetical protein